MPTIAGEFCQISRIVAIGAAVLFACRVTVACRMGALVAIGHCLLLFPGRRELPSSFEPRLGWCCSKINRLANTTAALRATPSRLRSLHALRLSWSKSAAIRKDPSTVASRLPLSRGRGIGESFANGVSSTLKHENLPDGSYLLGFRWDCDVSGSIKA